MSDPSENAPDIGRASVTPAAMGFPASSARPRFFSIRARAAPIGALAHLQLGRAFVLSADKIKAKAAYQDFLTLWKDTDSDIPILVQAKAEYAKLR